MLVDHALTRFSTDNLSCMVIRFDSKLVQSTVERKTDLIGVEGDPTVKGGVTEIEKIVSEARRKSGSGPSGTGAGGVGAAVAGGTAIDGSVKEEDETEGVEVGVKKEMERLSDGEESGPELDPTGPLKAMKNPEAALKEGKEASSSASA